MNNISVFLSNFIPTNLKFEQAFEECTLKLVNILETYKFAILESKCYSTTRQGNLENYRQLIAMKPLLSEGAVEQFTSEGPIVTINLKACKKANFLEQIEGLRWAKILAGQLTLFLAFPLEEVMNWISQHKESDSIR